MKPSEPRIALWEFAPWLKPDDYVPAEEVEAGGPGTSSFRLLSPTSYGLLVCPVNFLEGI